MEKVTNIQEVKEKISKEEYIPFDAIEFETLKEMFISTVKFFEPNLELAKNFEKVLNLILLYLQKDKEFEKQGYTLKKGFIIMGGVGTGKTLLLKSFQLFLKNFTYKNELDYLVNDSFRILPAFDIASKFNVAGFRIFEDAEYNYLFSKIGLDDLGAESDGLHYGLKASVIAELIQRRYERNKHRSIYATTNLNRQMLEDFYGSRIYSRLNELCNFFVLDGEDHRIK